MLFLESVFKNFCIALLWHIIILLICVYASADFFDFNKKIYKIRPYENEFFYVKYLKIKYWKDKLPQFSTKTGFSKKTLLQKGKISKEYLTRFIVETCRGEWNHTVCCAGSFFMIFFFKSWFFVIPTVVNIPFACVQRFNRIRLLRVYDKLFGEKIKKTAKISSLT